MMAENRKYYYLKLKDNFFDSDKMIVLEDMPDGYLYSNILLKLYLRSLRDDGRLLLDGRIPYSPRMIASVIRHQVKDVEDALKVFEELGLIEVLDNGAIFMTDIQNFIGQSSTEADRQRDYQRRIAEESANKSYKIPCKKSNMESNKKSCKKFTPENREKILENRNKNSLNTISSEPEKSAPSGILLNLIDGTDYDVSEDKIKTWAQAYPAVDIRQELFKMTSWLDANPTRRKTRRGIDRFIVGWLERAQNRGGGYQRYEGGVKQNEDITETGTESASTLKLW